MQRYYNPDESGRHSVNAHSKNEAHELISSNNDTHLITTLREVASSARNEDVIVEMNVADGEEKLLNENTDGKIKFSANVGNQLGDLNQLSKDIIITILNYSAITDIKSFSLTSKTASTLIDTLSNATKLIGNNSHLSGQHTLANTLASLKNIHLTINFLENQLNDMNNNLSTYIYAKSANKKLVIGYALLTGALTLGLLISGFTYNTLNANLARSNELAQNDWNDAQSLNASSADSYQKAMANYQQHLHAANTYEDKAHTSMVVGFSLLAGAIASTTLSFFHHHAIAADGKHKKSCQSLMKRISRLDTKHKKIVNNHNSRK